MQTIDLINNYIKKFKEQISAEKAEKAEKTDGTKNTFNQFNFDHMYRLGQLILANVPNISKIRKQNGRDHTYVAWKWYSYILRKFDPKVWFNINYADQYRVETKLIWNGETSFFSYGVDEISISTKTGKPLNTISEQTVNEGMRCYAKHASLKTGLFCHLWYEGEND